MSPGPGILCLASWEADRFFFFCPPRERGRGECGRGERARGEALLRLDRGTPRRIGTGRRVGAAGASDSTVRGACLPAFPCAVSWRVGIARDVDTHPLFALARLERHSFRLMTRGFWGRCGHRVYRRHDRHRGAAGQISTGNLSYSVINQ
jgi:hypothetical protein